MPTRNDSKPLLKKHGAENDAPYEIESGRPGEGQERGEEKGREEDVAPSG